MSKYKVWVNNFEGKPEERIINSKQLVDILLNFAGGGYSTSQTINAMQNKHKIDNNEQVTINYKNNQVNFIKL